MAIPNNSLNKLKLSRKGRKLQVFDDQRILASLPKDVPERTWAEILQKEDVDLMIFEIREDILDAALNICYDKYMEKQVPIFTVHCVAQAWIKLINWHFYRHDPGEDPSASPPCFIPKRRESWIPDEIPDPSPKDTWGRHDLPVLEETHDQALQKKQSSNSLEYPHVEEVPSEYWFPGKINLPHMQRHKPEVGAEFGSSVSTTSRSEEDFMNESEVLQKVTDYSTDELSKASAKVSEISALKNTTPVNGSLHGAGDSNLAELKPKQRKVIDKSKSLIRTGMGRSHRTLPPLDTDSKSRISFISDCRLRSLRLDTQFEISSEKVDTPPTEIVRRK